MPRKRTHEEMDTSEPPQGKHQTSMLSKIRNMWEFAAVMQYIFMFGKAVRIDEDFDIEDFEEECLKPTYSEKLEEIGLTLLKFISSHRGLNFDIWDEYTRRQYQSKAPLLNPYGDDEESNKFRNFDIFLKIRVLHQLTIWTFFNSDRIRERMPDEPREVDQLSWRVEEFGYDRDDRQYYLLDDNRLYRRTEPPLPPAPKAKPKASSKKAQAARRRASKRQRVEDSETPEVEAEEPLETKAEQTNGILQGTPSGGDVDTFGGQTWECLAITLPDYQDLVESFKKTKDPNEKNLRKRLIDEVIPIIEAAEEKQRRKIERRERELMALEKMATAKRSTRIAGKLEREKQEQDEVEAERKRAADLAAARRDQEKQEQMLQDRESRMMTREQRIKDREFKRILAEEEIARAAEEQKRIDEGGSRGSERQLKERIAKNKKDLEELEDDEDWVFDCSGCGVYGKNIDDGAHSVACEKCSVWQHSKCLKITKAEADSKDFNFVCQDCKRKEEEANRPKISLKFNMGSSPAAPKPATMAPAPTRATQFAGVEIPRNMQYQPRPQAPVANGYATQQHSGQHYGQHSRPVYAHPETNGHTGYNMQQPGHATYQHPYAGMPPQQPAYASSVSPPVRSAQVQYGQQPTYQPRPVSSGQQWARPPVQDQRQQQYYNPPPYPQQYHNAMPQAYQQQRPPSSHGAGRLSSSHSQTNGHTPSTARLTSPVMNQPTMTPTQGNYDTSRVAGIQNKATPSPHLRPNGTPTPHTAQMQPPPSSSSSSTPQQPTGISPTKHSPAPTSPSQPLPPPSNIPMKMSMSPPYVAQQQRKDVRTVSGTPIMPPVERLQPSPGMGERGAVPTPTKGSPPVTHTQEEVVGGVAMPSGLAVTAMETDSSN